MNKTLKKVLITIGVFAAFAVFCMLLNLRGVDDFHERYEGVDLTDTSENYDGTMTYVGYLAKHKDAPDATKSVEVDLLSYSHEGVVEEYKDFEGADKAVFTDVNSVITWNNVNVPEEGFYNIEIEFYLPKSHGVPAERTVKINEELPFDGARNCPFTRIWTDNGEKKVDNQGNEIRPSQIEVYDWQTMKFVDSTGCTADPFKFYFKKGSNSLTFVSNNEPAVLKKVTLTPIQTAYTYENYKADNAGKSDGGSSSYSQIIEGEDATLRSESSLYAKYDRSSPSTVPSSVSHTVLNYTGGEPWKATGQWIEWDFSVPCDGFYNISIKGRQNYQRGSVSCRKVLIDGQVPFDELKAISFSYNNDWECKVLSDKDGNPFDFYLTGGDHKIRLEVTLGDLGPILDELQNSTARLNQMYRKILVYTGATPDKYRDYAIDKTYPEVMDAIDIEAKRLYKAVDDMVAYSGQKADQIATAQTLATQLDRFKKHPNKITTEFTTFKDNITSLGTAQLNMKEAKLDIDYIQVVGTSAKANKDKAGIGAKAWHELKSFVASFFVDYNSVGDKYDDKDKVVKVWVLTGRDQGTILKSLIDNEFIPKTNIKVNVEIVAQDALLKAVLAGRGPNVVLSVSCDQPVNYALRGAAVDLMQFPDVNEVLKHFEPSSYEQIGLDGALYGLPETQTFNVLFYRKDVLDELNLDIPQTWQDLIEMLPTIQGKNLSVGIPSAAGSSNTSTASTAIMSTSPDLSMYFSLLFQNGGDMYNEEGNKTVVDSEAGIKAFDDYTRYFTDYGLPTVYDFVSRFRSGEMPIGIAPYSTYNTLTVSAPEIKGLWDFTLIPGTEYYDEDGGVKIDRSDFIVGNATMMIETDDEELKQQSWEFMKWWASTETQVNFGREMEALLGASARYNTSNRDAFSQLSWSAENIAVLNSQWDQTVGIREVPGGYFTGRHISNAVRRVINTRENTRETIIDYAIKIDEEITKKRTEFGMSIYGE